ncbi:MAG: family 2A encapsulin nanocompartment cargo protein cysteine desulfurase [Methylocella sp.]
MSTPDPKQAAATAPIAAPAAPQYGGQGPAVIDPGLIARMANSFFNAAPGQMVDPQALANFMVQDRLPIPPTSAPGTIGAVVAAPGTSIPGAQSVPFVTELPGVTAGTAGAPIKHAPAAGHAAAAADSPAVTTTPESFAASVGLAPEEGPDLPHPRAHLREKALLALVQGLGDVTSLTPSTFPSGFSHSSAPAGGLSPAPSFPAGFSHGSVPMGSPKPPETSLSFLKEAGLAFAPPSPSAPAQSVTAPPTHAGPPGVRGSAPVAAEVPGSSIEQHPAFASTNYPTETDLRPHGVGDVSLLGAAASPSGFSQKSSPGGYPAVPGESLYFLNETQTAAAPAAANAPTQHSFFAPVAPELKPLLTPDLVSGTRAFDAYAIKRDFPILRQQVHGKPLIWLDNAATTQKPQAVIDRLAQFYETENSNIHRGAHALAARSTDAYEAAREKVRRFLGASSPNDIVFARGATEAINLVAKAWGVRNVREGDEIVITWLEHHANIVPWQMLCAETGAVLRVAPVDDSGQILLDEYTKLLGPRTRLVSLPQVSNALGTVTPAQEMVAIAHRHGACVLVDGAQAVSHMPVNVQTLDCDFYAFSGHKVFGPTGIGVLYGKPEVLAAMPPWQGGGNMIADVTFEKTVYQGPPLRFEAGTGNIADAVGLGAAIDYLDRIGMGNIAAYEHELLGYATQGLLGLPGLKIIGTAKEKAGVISFVLNGCRSEDVGAALDREGIAVRAGHHCAQPILRRFGLETTVRPSLALYNTFEDIDCLVAALHRIQPRQDYGRGRT